MTPTDENYGHDFGNEEVPVCKKCGMNKVKAHIWGDSQWTQNPISCGASFVEKKDDFALPEKDDEGNISVLAQVPDGPQHEVIAGLTSIIIPIYTHQYHLMHTLGNCLGSIHEHTDKTVTPYEIILVDNASPISFEPQDYPVDKVIVNKQNLGYAAAVNKGIRVSQGEYICLMNSDVQVYADWLPDLQEALSLYDLVMATPMYGLPFARAVEAKKKHDETITSNTSIYSDFRDFSCVLMKRELLDEIGLFDEQFFMYGEDLDFFRRMDQAQKKYASTKRVNTHHIIGGTALGLAGIPETMDESKEKLKRKWGV